MRVSQEITAKKIGVSRQTYNAIEIGKRDIL
ncbi:MAG: helix-turn-helix domain-containing protein [Acetatifactor sp.]|nr:helix-turn-helix domain-containing protein [Acetatifactor sp.]